MTFSDLHHAQQLFTTAEASQFLKLTNPKATFYPIHITGSLAKVLDFPITPNVPLVLLNQANLLSASSDGFETQVNAPFIPLLPGIEYEIQTASPINSLYMSLLAGPALPFSGQPFDPILLPSPWIVTPGAPFQEALPAYVSAYDSNYGTSGPTVSVDVPIALWDSAEIDGANVKGPVLFLPSQVSPIVNIFVVGTVRISYYYRLRQLHGQDRVRFASALGLPFITLDT